MFKNEEFDQRINDVQRKIEQMRGGNVEFVAEPGSPLRASSPVKASAFANEHKVDAFYNEMAKFYERPEKHKSPTRRLRQQIDCAFEQKGFLSQQAEFRHDRGNYGLTYVVGVSKVYVVQPEEGELPYELAEKNPLAFYRKVMEGDVKEHKVCKSPQRNRAMSSNGLPARKTKRSQKFQY